MESPTGEEREKLRLLIKRVRRFKEYFIKQQKFMRAANLRAIETDLMDKWYGWERRPDPFA
jgi:hypothetical protein